MKSPVPWLFSPSIDLWTFLGSAVLSLGLLAIGAQLGLLNAETPEWTWVAAILLVDVAHVYELERGGMSDADQLAYSVQEGRAILTHNAKDFVPLAVEYFFNAHMHPGIILSPQIAKGELIRRALNLLRSLSAEDVVGTVRYLADYG